MSNIDVSSAVEAYESTHDVEHYVVDGWHVWPLLRTAIRLQWLSSERPRPASALRKRAGRLVGPLRRGASFVRAIQRRRRSTHRTEPESSSGRRADAVFLTLSERRVSLDGSSFEIYSDPFVDLLRERGLKALVWEEGEGAPRQHSESVKIVSRLDAETVPRLRRLREPAWFADFQTLVEGILRRDVAWAEIAPTIRSVTNRATVFERWLREANAPLLFLVCWYNPIAMAATLAARRCGVRTVEIQHGAGTGFFAHSGWSRAPSRGFEVIPDVFWCWGKTFADQWRERNPAFSATSSAVAGGNLWLNRWRQSAARPAAPPELDGEAEGGDRRILVSLQWDPHEHLLEAISSSPPAWTWRLRFHPSRSEADRLADIERCQRTGHPGIRIERAEESLLYDLLSACDVHLTESSTCAIEALAFGVPTIILGGSGLGETGKHSYRRFIAEGLMGVADTAGELIEAVRLARPLDPASQLISDLFAADDTARDSLRLLLQDAESRRSSCGRS